MGAIWGAYRNGSLVTVYLCDGRTCAWVLPEREHARELVELINEGVRSRRARLMPVESKDEVRRRRDLSPPEPEQDWLRLRASTMAKEAAAFASGEEPDTGRRKQPRGDSVLSRFGGWCERAILWLAGK